MADAAPQLIVLSHRLPVTYDADLGWCRSPGGLVSALEPAMRMADGVWMGHCDTEHGAPHDVGAGFDLLPIEMTEYQRRNAICGFANRTLWPALHGLIDNIEQLPDWWKVYQERGAATARRIAGFAERGAAVWVHDYHHFTVAKELRDHRDDLRIGLFCHTPTDAAGLTAIAPSAHLADCLHHFDFIGTQTEHDAQQLSAFMNAHRSSAVSASSVEAVPVGFDVDKWLDYRVDPLVEALSARMRLPGGLLAVGVDRADYTKGLLHKLLAIELVLDQGAVSPDDFRIIQVALPTRQEIPVYQFLEKQLREVTTRINTRHRRSDRLPVVMLQTTQLSPREVAGRMRAADIALITPVRDGMNLVALEFSVLNGDRPTEVILGRGAGAAGFIGAHCELVDATEVLSIAGSLCHVVHRLRGNPDRYRRRGDLRQRAAGQLTSERWTREFMRRLTGHRPLTGMGIGMSGRVDPGRFRGGRERHRAE